MVFNRVFGEWATFSDVRNNLTRCIGIRWFLTGRRYSDDYFLGSQFGIQKIYGKFVQNYVTMTFEEYLTGKKIDKEKFLKAEPQMFQEWSVLFAQMHPESFTAQKKFLINPIRRKYHL